MSLSILSRGVVMGTLLCIPAFAASRSVTVEVKTPGTFPTLLSADAAADVDDLTCRPDTLTPVDSNYTNARRITTDEAWFWQSPK